MGRHRPRRSSHFARSLSLTIVATMTTLGALSMVTAPSAQAAEGANRPVGLVITNARTGAPVAGAGYHLCGLPNADLRLIAHPGAAIPP